MNYQTMQFQAREKQIGRRRLRRYRRRNIAIHHLKTFERGNKYNRRGEAIESIV